MEHNTALLAALAESRNLPVTELASTIQKHGLLLPTPGSRQKQSKRLAALEMAASSLSTGADRLRASKDPADREKGFDLLSLLISESSTVHFLQHYASWGESLQAELRAPLPADPVRLRGAALRALAALYRRAASLLDVPGVRRSVSQLTGKVTPLVLGFLRVPEAGGDAAAESAAVALVIPAVRVLGLALRTVPSSLRSNEAAVDAALIQVMRGGAGEAAAFAAARALAALPCAPGDESAWSDMARRLIATCHYLIGMAYHGRDVDVSVIAALESSLTKPDGAATWQEAVSLGPADRRPATAADAARTLGPFFATLETLISAPFPVPVPFPGTALVLLCTRVAALQEGKVQSGSGGAPPTLLSDPTAESLLPSAQATALGLLSTTLRVAGAALRPLHAPTARALSDRLRLAAAREVPQGASPLPAAVRRELYAASASLVCVAGAPVARLMADVVLAAVSAEVYGTDPAAGGAADAGSSAAAVAGALGSGDKKKRKRDAGPSTLSLEALGLEGASAAPGSAPEGAMEALSQAVANEALGTRAAGEALAAQGGALALLEVLVRVGAASMGLAPRAVADAVAAHAALTAARTAQALTRTPNHPHRSLLRHLRLSSLGALLSSTQAPCEGRPRNLPLAARLLAAAARDPDAAIAELGQRGSQAIESMLHPRDLPAYLHKGAGPAAASRAVAAAERAAAAEAGVAVLPAPRMWYQVGPPAPVRDISSFFTAPPAALVVPDTAAPAPAHPVTDAARRADAAVAAAGVPAAPPRAAVPAATTAAWTPVVSVSAAQAAGAAPGFVHGGAGEAALSGALALAHGGPSHQPHRTAEAQAAAAAAPAAQPSARLVAGAAAEESDDDESNSMPSIDSGSEGSDEEA